MVMRFTKAAVLTGISLLAATALAADVRTVVKRNQIEVGESFHVEFISNEKETNAPDFSPLKKDFRVLGNNQKSTQSVINGVVKIAKKWTVELSPKRAGRLKIPALKFGNVKSREAFVQVKKAKPAAPGKAEDIFIEMTAQPLSPYVQAQVQVITRLYTIKNLRGSISDITAENDAIIKKVGDAKNYKKIHRGRNYSVHENRYFVYPQNSGTVKIKPPQLDAQYTERGRRYTVRKSTAPATLNVRPAPASFTGVAWLPAERIHLSEAWSEDLSSLQAGTPLVRTIAIRGRGISSAQLPEIKQNEVDNLRLYPEQATLKDNTGNTLASERIQKFVLIPSQGGQYKLPEIRIPWWNTKTDKTEYATLPARTLSVEEAAAGLIITPEPVIELQPPPAVDTDDSNLWVWVSAFMLLGWIATIALVWKQRGIVAANAADAADNRRKEEKQAANLRRCRRQLEKACTNDDPLATRNTMLHWAKLMWPDRDTKSLGQLALLVKDATLVEEIKRLDEALYSEHNDWSGNELWVALQAYSEAAKEQTDSPSASKKSGGLVALHKLK